MVTNLRSFTQWDFPGKDHTHTVGDIGYSGGKMMIASKVDIQGDKDLQERGYSGIEHIQGGLYCKSGYPEISLLEKSIYSNSGLQLFSGKAQ